MLREYDAAAEQAKLAEVEDDGIYHVYPNFGPLHRTTIAEGWCWCHPEVQLEPPYGALIVHNDVH